MSYSINGKIYTSHALMDEIVYNTKSIIKELIVKNEKLADSYETELSIEQADLFIACKNGTMELSFFPLTRELLIEYGCTPLQAASWVEDWTRIPEELRDEVLAFCCNNFIENYVEYNTYYRMLNGQPEYDKDHPNDYLITLGQYNYFDEEDNIIRNKFDDLLGTDYTGIEFDYDIPLNQMTIGEINALEGLGVLKAIRELEINNKTEISEKTVTDEDGSTRTIDDQGYHYKYLNYLGAKQIDIYNARIAKNWEILYLPVAEYLVQDKFIEFYNLNREIYERRTYQLAYTESSEYFEEMVLLLILSQTFADMITDTPEWYIRRDVFDLRTVQYFLTSQGVKFFEDIPMRFQIRIVKNLNKLIKYKSTDRNIFDILEIFNVEGVVLYKYFLYKNFLYKDTTTYTAEGEEEPEWSMEAEYDFEDEDEVDIGNTGDGHGGDVPGSEVYDFVDMSDEEYIDPNPGIVHFYDFRGEDPDYWDDYWDQYHEMLPEYDFMDEEETPNEAVNTANEYGEDMPGFEVYDFGFLDPSVIENYDERTAIYDFNNESAYIVPETEETDKVTDYQERITTIKDEFNNVYELQFFKTPVGKDWNDYIYNKFYREDYDTITRDDEYWDGQDTHNFIRNNHLRKDFTVEGTKYIGLEYNVDMMESLYEREYYLGTLLNARIDTTDVCISIPQLSSKRFSLINILLFVYCINGVYTNTSIPVQDATLAVTRRNVEKPDFDAYSDYEGGFPWTDPVAPEPEPEPVPFYGYDDYGCEDTDDIDPDTIEIIKDFGYNFVIDWDSVIYDNYDYGLITEEDEEDQYSPQPEPEPAIIPDFGYPYDAYVHVSSERPYQYCEQYYVDQNNGDRILITKQFMDEHQELWDTNITIIHKWTMLTTPEEFGFYTIDLDSHGPGNWDDVNQWEVELDGGHEPYSGRMGTHTFYDYIRSDHPDIYVDPVGRIYGFNMRNRLEDIADAIGFRHSEFGFERGYTLEDCGVDKFISQNKFSSIDDLFEVYQNNTECYKSLIYKMQNANSRDERRVLEYVFMKLFTVPWDTSFYYLDKGEIAKTYDQILKERDYNLYSIYLELVNEGDSKLKIFNARNILNNVADTLNYYINGDNLKYILSFIATMSYDSILHYVFEMVNFFKSWKLHFLDPVLSYFIDDKTNNIAGYGDKLAEVKPIYWTSATNKFADTLEITPLYYPIEKPGEDLKNMQAEIVDISSHFTPTDILDDMVYDGSGPQDEDDYIILDGGGVHLLTEEQLNYANSHNIKVANQDCYPYKHVDGGHIADEIDLYDLDGGGPMDAPSYLDIDGLHVNDPRRLTPIDNYWESADGVEILVGHDVEGGRPNIHYIREKGIVTFIDDYNVISQNVFSSTFYTNGLTIEEDGIYFTKSIYAENKEIEREDDLATLFYNTNITTLDDLSRRAKYINPRYFGELINAFYEPKFIPYRHIVEVLDYSYESGISQISERITNEINLWFNEGMQERYRNLWKNIS